MEIKESKECTIKRYSGTIRKVNLKNRFLMTIQELIDLLDKAQDKSKNVFITDEMELVGTFEPIAVIEDDDILIVVE